MPEPTPKELETRRVRALVDLAQEGDGKALEELYLIHFDRIYGYLAVTVGNRHDAEDLTTKTFLRMIESIERFRWGTAPFSAWLFRIAHNAAVDHFRANRRWQPQEEVPEPPADASTSAEAGALAAIGDRSMLALIDELSLDQKQVLTLKFVYRFSNAETALVLGKSEGAVKSLQHRALASLQRKLAARGGPDGA